MEIALIKTCRFILKALDRITDLVLYVILSFALLFGAYSIWESGLVYRAAEADNYTVYRPAENDSISFDELRAINPEVVAWLTVNDTPIDYPVARADNNDKYVNTNALGEYTLSGAIFLDYRNSADFTDQLNILYGHYMEKKLMFGSLGDYTDQRFLEEHAYGNLFYDGQNHGLEFFALVLTDAYDQDLYAIGISTEEEILQFLDDARELAVTWRDTDLSAGDRYYLLSTCTTEITNGRYLLIGRETEELHLQEPEEPVEIVRRGSGTDRLTTDGLNAVPVIVWIFALAALVILLTIL